MQFESVPLDELFYNLLQVSANLPLLQFFLPVERMGGKGEEEEKDIYIYLLANPANFYQHLHPSSRFMKLCYFRNYRS